MLKRLESRKHTLFALAAVVGVLILLPPVLPKYVVILMTQSLVYAIVAMSLDVLIGYTNLKSLGHGSFFAIGAYTSAILVTKLNVGFGASLLASMGMAAGLPPWWVYYP